MREDKKLEYISITDHNTAKQYGDEKQTDILVNYARKNPLYMSGGSDYHGSKKPDIEVGIGKGNLNISKAIIEEWVNQ